MGRLESDVTVHWWTETPFNYSAVNNAGAARRRRGAGLPQRRHRAARPGLAARAGRLGDVARASARRHCSCIGPDGRIQHAGVDPRPPRASPTTCSQGMRPDATRCFGPTDWYRNVPRGHRRLHCAVRRELFDAARRVRRAVRAHAAATSRSASTPCCAGLRNVCSPFAGVRHLESATRGTHDPDRRLLRQLLALPTPGCSAATRTSRRTCRSVTPVPALRVAARADARGSGCRSRSAASSTVFRQKSDAAESR